jgi:hypothetical protein
MINLKKLFGHSLNKSESIQQISKAVNLPVKIKFTSQTVKLIYR